MFTGIVREVGLLQKLVPEGRGLRVEVRAPRTARSLEPGGSVAVDGVCLTVTETFPGGFRADVCRETISRTRLAGQQEGDRVNLELPLCLGQRLDGHLVQGHVDATAQVTRATAELGQTDVSFRVGPGLAPYLAEKGSVAVNGVSLTITRVGNDSFSVALIPTTLSETNLDELREGSSVNVEVDVLARYAARREEVSSWLAS